MTQYAYYDFPLGTIKIGCEDNSIVFIKSCDSPEMDHCPCAVSDLAAAQLKEYFDGKRKAFSLPLAPDGTQFQKAVWDALLHIPYGETRSYQDIAIAIGNPGAARAVGMACNKNPLWIVIPCHRVVGTNRKLTGYAGGLDMKKNLLELEKRYK